MITLKSSKNIASRLKRFAVVGGLCLSLGACSTLFGPPEAEPTLPGERLSILEFENTLSADSGLNTDEMVLPSMWKNASWPQFGGYPNHDMGHLSLGTDLERAWSRSIGEGTQKTKPLVTSPIIADELVFTLDTNMRVSAFHLETGKRHWSMPLPLNKEQRKDALGGGLAYADGKIFSTTGLKTAFVLNSDTGDILKQIDLKAPVRSAPTVIDNRLFLQSISNTLDVYNINTYDTIWQYNGFNETTTLLNATAPAVNKDMVIAALSTGEIISLRCSNGQGLWSDNLSSVRASSTSSAIADIKGGVVIDRTTAYAASYNDRMTAIDLVTGKRIWQKEIGSSQTPWSADAVLYLVSNDNQLVALNKYDGAIFWIKQLETDQSKLGGSWFGPVFAGNRLIVVNTNGKVFEYNPQTADLLNTWSIKSTPITAPIVADDHLIFLTETGKLIAYR